MNNPILEPSPTSLDELFSRDPNSYLAQDKEKIYAELRRQRENWLTAEAAGKRTAKAPKAAKEPKPTVTLEDLGL